MHQIIIIGFSLLIVLVKSHHGHETTTVWSQRDLVGEDSSNETTTVWSQRDLVEEDSSNETYSDSGSGMGSDNNTSELPSSSLQWLFASFRNSSENCTGSNVGTERRGNSLDGQESSTIWSTTNLGMIEESTTDISNSTQMNPTEESAVISSNKSTVSPAEIIMKWLLSSRNSSENIQRNNSFLGMIKRSNDNQFQFDNMNQHDDRLNFLNEIPRGQFESGMGNSGMGNLGISNLGMGNSEMGNSGMNNLEMSNFGFGNGFPQKHASSTESSLSAEHNTQPNSWFQWLFGR